jgi:hypothetical protein
VNSWVFAFRVEPPSNETILARTGISTFFASYSRLTDRWHLIGPGGEERINEPQWLFLDDQYVKDHPGKRFAPVQPKLRRSKKPQQMQLL